MMKIGKTAIMIVVFFIGWTPLYAYDTDDKYESMSAETFVPYNGSYVFAPSYVSAADQKTEDVAKRGEMMPIQQATAQESMAAYPHKRFTLPSYMPKDLASIFKSLFKNRKVILSSSSNSKSIDKVIEESTLSAPVINLKESKQNEMRSALTLASILKNPTEDQKVMLSAVESLMNIEEESGPSPELSKATEELIEMVAVVLLAQRLEPDRLNEEDMTSLKNIFLELDTAKDRIILEYDESVTPYYGEIKDDLVKNMNMLQLKNIISITMTEEELKKMTPLDITELLDKLRISKDKSFEEEYILQQEAKYRERYLDPNKKTLKRKLSFLLEDFARRISSALKT